MEGVSLEIMKRRKEYICKTIYQPSAFHFAYVVIYFNQINILEIGRAHV